MFDLINVAIEEILTAFNGGDWGFGALAELTGNDNLARALVNFAAFVGGK